MAYIPPHKRHTKDKERPTPTPDLLVPLFKKNLNLRPSRSTFERRKDKHILQLGKIIYANQAISRWCAVGLTDDNNFACLEPISLESIEQKIGEKPLALVNTQLGKDDNEVRGSFSESPWVSIAENVLLDLLSSLKNVRNEMDCQELEEVEPSLVARFGKILFHGSPSVSLETVRKNSVTETPSIQLKRSFYTNVTTSYMENIIDGVVPEIGVDFEGEKELYHVKLSDISQPDATISCKCSVMKDDKKLELYKVELHQVRHLVIDIMCVDKNLDLRLMLFTKRILTALADNEKDSIRDLISSAVLDPDVKGGLRWPLGKESSGDRYSVVGVCHTKDKAYKSSSLRLQVRDVDRFNFRTSTGEVTREVILKMTGIVSQLQDQKVEINSLSDMLKDTLKLIWDHFIYDALPEEKEETTEVEVSDESKVPQIKKPKRVKHAHKAPQEKIPPKVEKPHQVPTKKTTKETQGAQKEKSPKKSKNVSKSAKKLEFQELVQDLLEPVQEEPTPVPDSIGLPSSSLNSVNKERSAVDQSMELLVDQSNMVGFSESAPAIIEDTDSIFVDLDQIISGVSSQATSTYADKPQSEAEKAPPSQEVAKAKDIFEKCLPLDFKLLLHPGRQAEFLEAITILSSSSDFPSDKIFALEKFQSDFPSLASDFQSSERELEETQKLIDLKVSLAATLEQHAAYYKVLKTKEESINEEIKRLQEELKLKEEEKKEIISKKQDLAKDTQVNKSTLAKHNTEAPSWEKKKKKAEDITSHITYSWDNFKKNFV